MAPVTSFLPDPEMRWRRVDPRPGVTPERLARWLAGWPDLLDRDWTLLDGGLRSLNLRSGELVVRVALADDHDLAKEAAVLDRVAGEVRAPRVLRRGERALVVGYIEHERVPATKEAGRAVGRAAARIHAHQFERSGLLGPDLAVVEPFTTAVDGLLSWAGGLLDGRAGEVLWGLEGRVRDAWQAGAARMRESAAQPVLVHADFKPANLRWLPGEMDVVVFDWDFAWSGPALMDLGQLRRWSPPEAFLRGVELGYRQAGGDLPDDWRRLADLFDLFNMVAFLARGGDPVREADVLERVRRTVAPSAP